jgi:hypothetical protein
MFFFLFIQVVERGAGKLKRSRIATGESFITHVARCADMEIYSLYFHDAETYLPYNLA